MLFVRSVTSASVRRPYHQKLLVIKTNKQPPNKKRHFRSKLVSPSTRLIDLYDTRTERGFRAGFPHDSTFYPKVYRDIEPEQFTDVIIRERDFRSHEVEIFATAIRDKFQIFRVSLLSAWVSLEFCEPFRVGPRVRAEFFELARFFVAEEGEIAA